MDRQEQENMENDYHSKTKCYAEAAASRQGNVGKARGPWAWLKRVCVCSSITT